MMDRAPGQPWGSMSSSQEAGRKSQGAELRSHCKISPCAYVCVPVRVRPAYHPQANTGMLPAEARRQEGWGYLLSPTTPPRLDVSAPGKVGLGEYRPVGLTQSHKTRKQGFTIPEPEEGVGGGGGGCCYVATGEGFPCFILFHWQNSPVKEVFTDEDIRAQRMGVY